MPHIMEITDFNAPELDIYARKKEGELLHLYGKKGGIFIAESPKVVERALDAGYKPLSFLVEKKHIEGEAKEILARCPDVPVYTAEFDILTRLTGFPLTRGILCAMRRLELPAVTEVCAGAKRIVILENVMNPTNVGAIFRSAAALGMDGILLTAGCTNPLYRRSVRVSMGTVFQIPWTFLDSVSESVPNSLSTPDENRLPETDLAPLRKAGFKTAAMALWDNSVSIDDPALSAEDKLAIVLGTEGDGLAAKTITNCDYTVKIPMSYGVDSLNVAAASAVAFWQLGRH